MLRKNWRIAVATTFVLALSGAFAATAAEDKSDNDAPEADPLEELLGDSEDCVYLNRIDRTEVIDPQTVVFHMNGGEVYANRLPHRCPGLRHNKAIMYKTSLSKLCKVDVITVVEDMGFGLSQGASCGLGSFVPIDEATVELLRDQDK